MAWRSAESTRVVRGEAADPYYRLAFRGSDPLDAEFEEIAIAVFDPMRAAMREESAA
jgi:exodeoxyribonuclease V gamma subunit